MTLGEGTPYMMCRGRVGSYFSLDCKGVLGKLVWCLVIVVKFMEFGGTTR